MSQDSNVLSLAERLGRRGFIAKLALAAVSVTTALVGQAQAVHAVGTLVAGCCSLCRTSTSGCTGQCCWSWTCCGASGTNMQVCKECYTVSSCAGDGCTNNRCSEMIVTHARCA
ncbi:MAG TPA: hypothetical protein VGO86_15080 [Candidatus Dormibacteraeota bacterium]